MLYYLVRLTIILALAYAVACVAVVFLQRHLIYVPAKEAGQPADFGLPGVTVGSLETPDGEHLETWRWHGSGDKPVIVFFHGNAGNLEDRHDVFQMFRGLGYGFVALDYRGYGNSTGTPSYKALINDALLVFDHTSSSPEFAGRKMVLYGESLGTGVATEVATRRRVGGLILQSPYTTVADAARERFPWLPVDLLLTERFSTVPQISSINAPLLVLHGAEDELFPSAMAQRVFDEASGRKVIDIMAGLGHNDIYPDDIEDAIADFVEPTVAGRAD